MSAHEVVERRILTGRLITLIAATVYCVVRGLAYLPGMGPSVLAGPVALISWDGDLLWMWSTAWILGAVLCLVDMVRRSTRWGLSLTVGLTAAWGLAYMVAWVLTEFGSRSWLTGATMLLVATMVYGLVQKISALRDLTDTLALEVKRLRRDEEPPSHE